MIAKQKNLHALEPFYTAIKKSLKLSGKDWENMVKLMNNHPLIKQMAGHPYEKYVGDTEGFIKEAA